MKGRTAGILLFSLLFLLAVYVVLDYLGKVYKDAVSIEQEEPYIYVRSDFDLSDLSRHMHREGILKDTASFLWLAEKKSFDQPLAGRYRLKDGMSNNQLINLLRSGMQEPLQLTINSVRSPAELASRVGSVLELDSAALIEALNSEEVAISYGFTPIRFISMIIPNTYEFYWNTDAKEFLDRMAREYKRFWNDERKQKAASLGLSQSEVSTLASIVQAEQQEHPEERPRVAGLYLNRLRRGMRLQSDPTLIYAIGDFTIKRVLNEHKEIDSPYNTYKYAGLPPGPINLPSINSLKAVLNAEEHNFLYMCARSDFSGFHHFSPNLRQHNQYARQYRRELNKRRILR